MMMESFVNNILTLMSYHLFLRRNTSVFENSALNTEDMFQITMHGKEAVATYEAVVTGNIL